MVLRKVLLSACFVTCAVPLSAQADVFFMTQTTTSQPSVTWQIIHEDGVGQHSTIHRHWRIMTPALRAEVRRRMHERWLAMTPQQRRSEIREHWQHLTPEERDRQRAEMHQRFRNMSQQERAQLKLDMGGHDNPMSGTGIMPVADRR